MHHVAVKCEYATKIYLHLIVIIFATYSHFTATWYIIYEIIMEKLNKIIIKRTKRYKPNNV